MGVSLLSLWGLWIVLNWGNRGFKPKEAESSSFGTGENEGTAITVYSEHLIKFFTHW
jgi:hypothetical protein